MKMIADKSRFFLLMALLMMFAAAPLAAQVYKTVDADGNVIATGYSGTPNESIAVEVAAGTYYIRIYGWQEAHNSYGITVSN